MQSYSSVHCYLYSTAGNATASNATSQPLTSTTAQVQGASTTNITAAVIEPNTDLALCTCDLTQSVCDINCCCDAECTADARVVFSTCSDEVAVANSDLCTYNITVFKNNVAVVETVNNPFVFCIWMERNTARNYYNPVPLVQTDDSFNTLAEDYTGYTYEYQYPTSADTEYTDLYKSGKTLIILRNLMAGILYIPTVGGVTSSCIDKNPARFLEDFSSTCMRNLAQPLDVVCDQDTRLSSYNLDQDLKNVVSVVMRVGCCI